MATRENMEKKLVLLEQRLKEYGHVPTQKEDRPLYANTKYYYTNYPFHPIVKRLMEKFPFETSRSRQTMSREESIRYLQNELEQRGKIPGPTEDRALYSKIKYYYDNYSDLPEVAELMAKYPLIAQKKPSQFTGMTFDEKVDLMEEYLRRKQTFGMRSRMTANILRYYEQYPTYPRIAKLRMLFPNYKVYDELLSSCGNIIEYFKKCWTLYGETPGENSIPMEILIKDCRKIKYMLTSSLGTVNPEIQLVIDLIEQGATSKQLQAIYERIK